MAIKSSVYGAVPVPPVGFPKLMVSKGAGPIILAFDKGNFGSELKGVVVGRPTLSQPIGHTCNWWAADCFEDFDGSITLTNAKGE